MRVEKGSLIQIIHAIYLNRIFLTENQKLNFWFLCLIKRHQPCLQNVYFLDTSYLYSTVRAPSRNRSWIHKGRIARKKTLKKTRLDFKKWAKSIQTTGYNGARTVSYIWMLSSIIKFALQLIWIHCESRVARYWNTWCLWDSFSLAFVTWPPVHLSADLHT